MLKDWCVIISLMLLLSACAGGISGSPIAQKGAVVSDTALKDAVWWTCQGASIGAVKRMYQTSAERASLYREFCEGSGTANVVSP